MYIEHCSSHWNLHAHVQSQSKTHVMSMFDIAIAYMFPANFILSDYGKETALFYKRKLDPTTY